MSSSSALLETFNTTPLYKWHLQKGAKMVPFAGYEMPLQYPDGIISEHHHTRKSAGLFDVSHMGLIKVAYDPEHIWVLERVIPVDIKEMLPGQMKYGLLLSEDGYIMDDLIISRFEKYFLLVVNAGCKHQDFDYLKRFLKCEMLDDLALLALQGPKARSVMKSLCPDAVELTFMTTSTFQVMNKEVWISCSGYTGEDGFELMIPSEIAESAANALCADSAVLPIGLGARDSLRLEAGLCLYGHDMDLTQTPASASLTWSIGQRRRREGDFVGDEKILNELNQGAEMKRVGLKGLSKTIAREGAAIYDRGEKVGYVTSGVPSPSLGYPIAMGYVPSSLAGPDTALEIEVRGQRYPFVVTKMPFLKQNYYRG
ncbi:MAG: glycine cleavage system aminomethyltransferase GcvT [Alphaproteobacteria bacterium]|nr:glycine cleavage system aminomethyltransferase GcvT [Alphaproteobacteria bacterium]